MPLSFGKIFLILTLVLLVLPITRADSFFQCLNSTTLQHNTTILTNFNGSITTTYTTENIQCRGGCDNSLNVCKIDADVTGYEIPLILGLVLMAFIFFYLAIEFDESRKGLQILFFMLGFFILVGLTRVLGVIAQNKLQSNLVNLLGTLEWGLIALTTFIVGYFIIDFLRGIFEELHKEVGK